MISATTYRAKAGEQRAAASQTTLVSRREMHKRSAAMWDEMAQRLENTEQSASAVAKSWEKPSTNEEQETRSLAGWDNEGGAVLGTTTKRRRDPNQRLD